MKKHDIDEVLKQRAFQKSSDDFAMRIIAKAGNVEQKIDLTIFEWVKRLFAEFLLPKPVYTFASLLIIGFLLGFSLAANDVVAADNTSQDLFLDDGANL